MNHTACGSHLVSLLYLFEVFLVVIIDVHHFFVLRIMTNLKQIPTTTVAVLVFWVGGLHHHLHRNGVAEVDTRSQEHGDGPDLHFSVLRRLRCAGWF